MSESTVTYEQLAAYLAYLTEHLSDTLVDLDDVRPLAREVRLASVKALLFARQSDILDDTNVEQFPFFLELLNGVAIEVESVTGTDPQNTAVRALAVQAITLGTAAQIEFAAYPEQQLGDSARANQLQIRFEALMARLRGVVAEGAEGALPAVVTGPRGSFPPARSYPDPAERWPC